MPTNNTGSRHILKRLAVDVFMTLIFLLLLSFSAWLVWIYFFRGPIDIETRGFVTRTIREEPVQPKQVEKYTLEHFHNLDEVVVQGIQSGSPCLLCHGNYPHSKHEKVRSFFNAHSWFIACEVCHMPPGDGEQLAYRWVANDTGDELSILEGSAGNYGAMIVPVKIENGSVIRLDQAHDRQYIEEFVRLERILNDYQKTLAQKKIHQVLSESPVYCDACHTADGLLDFESLLYPPRMVMHLESLDMGAMVKTYKQFHLPGFISPKPGD